MFAVRQAVCSSTILVSPLFGIDWMLQVLWMELLYVFLPACFKREPGGGLKRLVAHS